MRRGPARAMLPVVLAALVLGPFSPAGAAAPEGCVELLEDGGFEAGGQGWVQESAQGNPLVSDFFPHQGALGAFLAGTNTAADRLSHAVSLPAGKTLTLSFWWALSTQETAGAFDRLAVELVDPASGAVLATPAAFDNSSAASWEWGQETVSLSSYAGRAVRLRFSAATDSQSPTSFFIDQASLLACEAGPAPRGRRYLPIAGQP
jgi:hypothetical protein